MITGNLTGSANAELINVKTSNDEVRVENNSGGELTASVVVKINGWNTTEGIPQVTAITSASDDTPLGIIAVTLANGAIGDILQYGMITTGLTASSVDDPIYSSDAGALQTAETDLIMGRAVSTDAGASKVLIKFQSSGGGDAHFVGEGSPSTAPEALGDDSIAVGDGASVASGSGYGIGIGYGVSVAGNGGNIAVGASSSIVHASAFANTVVGYKAKLGNATSQTWYSVAIGYKAYTHTTDSGSTVDGAVAIGNQAEAHQDGAISIGKTANVNINSSNGIAIGLGAKSYADGAIAIGYLAETIGVNSIAIGFDADIISANAGAGTTTHLGTIKIGYGEIGKDKNDAYTHDYDYSIAIGYNSKMNIVGGSTTGNTNLSYNISFGYGTLVEADSVVGQSYQNIAMGKQAKVGNSDTSTKNSIAFGNNSCSIVDGTINTTAVSIASKSRTLAGNNTEFNQNATTETYIVSNIIDLTSSVSPAVEITVPAGSTFWPMEVGVFCTEESSSNNDATATWESSGAIAIKSIETLSGLTAAGERQSFAVTEQTGVPGGTILEVNVAGDSGTTLTGRFYFKGLLVEDQ